LLCCRHGRIGIYWKDLTSRLTRQA
jgi:hypothetical protein